MIAKLENDYTVYAYDYSEYETPLVGQGMLSWVLATASPTPNAPARESGTMVTGRVCKNIMGLFASGGIKETLEVKLKLVPVPTRSKREYLQSMAVYRDPNVVMPDGFDNNAWNSFLQAIPDAGVLRDGSAGQVIAGRANMGSVEQLHDLLTPKYGPEDDMFSNGPGSSRPGSPTPSQRSMMNHGNAYHGSRPASRASFHQPQPSESAIDDQSFEDGPAKKRARLTQTDWHGRGSFGGNADSLRSAVTTAASIRNIRPSVIGNSSAGGDMIPRAPTPRPGEKRIGRPGMPRAGSSLRRESTGGQSPYGMQELDSGMYSGDYDAGSSRHGSPSPDLPSSPPEYTPAAEPPSSPLPELPAVPDSGFQSDLPVVPEQQNPSTRGSQLLNRHLARKARGELEWAQVHPGPRENLPEHSFPHFDPLSHQSAKCALSRKAPTSPSMGPANRQNNRAPSGPPREPSIPRQPSTTPAPIDSPSPGMFNPVPSIENSFPPTPADTTGYNLPPPAFNVPRTQHQQIAPPPVRTATLQRTQSSIAALPGQAGHQSIAPNGPTSTNYSLEPRRADVAQKAPAPKKAPRRALKKAQSWAAAESSDVDSDGGLGPVANANKIARIRGSGAVRSASIYNQLDAAVATGAPVRYCVNCGEIKTPTWRPYWIKVEDGDGSEVPMGGATGTHMVEPVEIDHEGKTIKYRVYKQYGHLSPEERKAGTYQQLYFCNPCGDYIRKHGKIRPREMWDPAMVDKTSKKPGRAKKKRGADLLTSDLPAPSSDWDLPTPFTELPLFTDPFGPSEAQYDVPPSDMGQFMESQPLENGHHCHTHQHPPTSYPPQQVPLNDAHEQEARADMSALQKAIQSSPARILTPRPSQQEQPVEGDPAPEDAAQNGNNEIVTPKPTRRLLFPSPRKDGEFKSLEASSSNGEKADANSPEGNTSQPLNKNKTTTTSNKTHPEQPRPMNSSSNSDPTQTKKQISEPFLETTEVDKENLPPAVNDDDEFAHLFEEGIFLPPATPGRKTPSKAIPRTPNSKSKNAFSTGLTPRTGSKRSAECMGPPDTPTPTKRRSPRLAEKLNGHHKEMTPFTKSLNQFLSDGLTSSPSKAFNWTLTSSPAKNLSSTFGDMAAISRLTSGSNGRLNALQLQSDDNLWSDFPMPSSPPFFAQRERVEMGMEMGVEEYDWEGLNMNMDMSMVNVFEDGTATEGMGKGWEGVFSDGAEGAVKEVVDASEVTREGEASVAVEM